MFKSSAFLKATADVNTSSQNRLQLHQLREQLLHRLSRMKDDISLYNRNQIQGNYSVGPIQQDKLKRFDGLVLDRNMINRQEELLKMELEGLMKQAENVHRDELRKGYRNQEADMQLTQKVKDLAQRMKDLDGKSDHIHNSFASLKRSEVSTAMTHNVSASSLYSDQLLLTSKLQRDQDRIYELRRHSQHDEVIPREKFEEIPQQYTNHAQFIYQGTKFQANDDQKLIVLTNLRKQIERHIQHRGLEGAIIDMPFLQGEQIQNKPQTLMEYDQTIWDILQLKNDYIAAGGSDPNMILQLNNLEAFYKQNHPARRQSLHKEMPTSNVNTMDRSALTEHPIFDYLPKSFQKQIHQIETENNIAKQKNMTNPILNETLRLGSKIESNLKSDESKVQYLKQAEMDLITSMIYDGVDKETKLKKLHEIAELKAEAEKSLFESRIQQSLAEREENLTVLNKKPSKVQKENYLSFLQGNLTALPLKYEPEEGFVVRTDFVSHLPVVYSDIKILMGLGFEITQDSERHPVTQENLHMGRSIILERFEYYDQSPDPETILFLKVQAYSEEVGGSLIAIDLGWTILKLFDEDGNLLSGRYILPLYDNKHTAALNVSSLPGVPSIKIGIRITLPKEPLLDSNDVVLEEADYKIPDLHIKKVTLLSGQPQVPMIKLREKLFPVELQGLNMNDPRLRNSQLPPNIYTTKFTVLDEEELSRRKELEEYEKSRASRPRLRAGGAGKSTEKSDTPAARPRLQKKSPAPPERQITKNDTQKFDTPRTPVQQQSFQQTPSQQQFYNTEQQPIFEPLSLRQENKMIFSLYRIDIIDTSLHPKMKLRIAIFVKDKIADGMNKKPLLMNMNLEPTATEADSFSFQIEHTFDFTLQDLFKLYNQDDLLDCYLFLGFFDENKLFAWLAQQVFEVKPSGLVISSGYFTDNLILPPGQQPPFDESKMKRSEIRIHYMLKQDDEPDTQLQEFDYYELVEKPKVQPTIIRKKIPVIENQRWVSQLRIDMTKLLKFETKSNISFRLALLHRNEVIVDNIKRPCLRQDNLDAFQGQNQQELNINQTIIFRLGLQYLLDTYQESTNEVLLFFTFFVRQTLVGIVQFPIYIEKSGKLVEGVQRVPLYSIDKTGRQGSLTEKQVEFTIREDPLRLDDIEETPKYLKPKPKLNIAPGDVQKRLIIHLIQLDGYDKAITYTIKLLNDGLIHQEENGGDHCIVESTQSFIPEKKIIIIDTKSYFNIPVNAMVEDQLEEIKKFTVVLEFNEERSKAALGWMVLPVIENYQFNSELKQMNLFQGKTPSQIDTLGVKPSRFTIKMQLLYDIPPKKQVIKEENRLTLVLLNVKGITVDAYCFIKMGIMVDSVFLKDESGTALAFTTNKVYNQDKVMDMDYETFYMRMSKEPMLNKDKDRTLLVFYIVGPDNQQIAWLAKPFFRDGEYETGKFTLQCFDKPFQKPPIKQKPKKNDVTIQFELQN